MTININEIKELVQSADPAVRNFGYERLFDWEENGGSMGNKSIIAEKFGKILIDTIKDGPLFWFDKKINNESKSLKSRGFHHVLSKLSKEEQDVVRDCIIDAVMTGLHDFLAKISEMNNFNEGIEITVDNINVFDINMDGLQYELFGEDGWEAKYSKYPLRDGIFDKYVERAQMHE